MESCHLQSPLSPLALIIPFVRCRAVVLFRRVCCSGFASMARVARNKANLLVVKTVKSTARTPPSPTCGLGYGDKEPYKEAFFVMPKRMLNVQQLLQSPPRQRHAKRTALHAPSSKYLALSVFALSTSKKVSRTKPARPKNQVNQKPALLLPSAALMIAADM